MSNFLPKGYKSPDDSPYTKLPEGDTVVRILSSCVIGWEGWIEDENGKKPVRFQMDEKPKDLSKFEDRKVNHFMAMVVWNYGTETIQIMSLAQKSIREQITDLASDEDWGNPNAYDIKISRKGAGQFDTKYKVTAKPKKEITKEIAEAFAVADVNLQALFTGDNPFEQAVQTEPEGADEDIDINDIPV